MNSWWWLEPVRVRRARSRRPKRGASLALVMGVTVVVALVGAGLISSAGAARTEAVRRMQSLQGFWAAESALAQARARLYTDPSFRNSPNLIAFTNGLTVGSASVARTGNVYFVLATGTNRYTRHSRRLAQEFVLETFDYWDDFALIAGASGINLAQSVSIYGDVYCQGNLSMSQSAAIFETLYCLGNLDMSQSAVVYDQAYIGGTISLRQSSAIYGGSYPFNSPANPYYIVQPQVPQIDWSWYQALLAQTSVRHSSNLNWSGNVNLGGTNNFWSGSASLQQSKMLTSTPPGGVLVVSGGFSLQQNAQIGPGVTVVCGTVFEMGQNTRIGSNAVIYAGNRINMKQSSIVATRCALVTPGTIDMKQAAQASGFIYAGELLDLSQSVYIQGLCYAGSAANLSQSVALYYNRSIVPGAVPGLETNAAVRLQPRQWREL
ncbi:MAG: hypothetical protein N2652_08900 [Kiritimatiellae bacterium]|nr:hypothetical protein [Kiritimatiellia bacterium]